MTEKTLRRKQKPSKVEFTVKRGFRFSDSTPARKKGAKITTSLEEYEFALANNCVGDGV